MNGISDMKKYVTTLVETNRALASDLDASRRVVAEVGRERDVLRREVARLRGESEDSVLAQSVERWRQDVEQLRGALADERGQLDELRQVRDELQRGADEERARLQRAEAQIDELTLALHRVEQERDSVQLQLEEATAALAEIHACLRSSLEGGFPVEELGYA